MDAQSRLRVLNSNIVTLDVDVIVNAANPQLLPGAGVCGAIHTAAGPELARDCAKVGGCETGSVVATPGYRLTAQWVLHCVGPVWDGGNANEDDLLASCYRRSLEKARELGATSIAFPAISTGVYGFPPDRAATIAVSTAAAYAKQHAQPQDIVFCCFDEKSAGLHRTALQSL